MKIVLLWPPWSWKSTYATTIAHDFDIPCLYLDKAFLDKHREKVSIEDWTQIIQSFVSRHDSRVIEWNYLGTDVSRFENADIAFYIECNTYISLWRCLKRFIVRSLLWNWNDIPEWIKEEFHLSFYRWIRWFNTKEKPKLLRIIHQHKIPLHIISSYLEIHSILLSHK